MWPEPSPVPRQHHRWTVVSVVLAVLLVVVTLYLILSPPSHPLASGTMTGPSYLNATVATPPEGWEPSNASAPAGDTHPNSTWYDDFSIVWNASGPISFIWASMIPGNPLGEYDCFGYTNCSGVDVLMSQEGNVSGRGNASGSTVIVDYDPDTTLTAWNYGNNSVTLRWGTWWNFTYLGGGGWAGGRTLGNLVVPPATRTPQWIAPSVGGLIDPAPSSPSVNVTDRWTVELAGGACVGFIGNFSGYAPGGWPYYGMDPNATASETYVPGPGVWANFTGPPILTTGQSYTPTLILRCMGQVPSSVTVRWYVSALPA